MQGEYILEGELTQCEKQTLKGEQSISSLEKKLECDENTGCFAKFWKKGRESYMWMRKHKKGSSKVRNKCACTAEMRRHKLSINNVMTKVYKSVKDKHPMIEWPQLEKLPQIIPAS